MKDLIEKRKALDGQIKVIVERASNEKRGFSPEEQKTFDGLHAEDMGLKSTIDAAAVRERERVESEEREETERQRLSASRGRKTTDETTIVAPTAEQDRNMALRAWALGGQPDLLTGDMLAAAQRAGVNPASRTLNTRALNSTTATQGLNTIPDEMMKAFFDVQKWFGSVRSAASVLRTASGADLPIPTGDDTANTGEIIADSGAVTTTVDPSFGQVVMKAFKFSSKAVILSVELLQDSGINIAPYIGTKLGQRIGRVQNTYFTTGTGTGEPQGVQVASALGKTAAATNLLTWDEVIDLQHSVDRAYRDRGSFMMHDTVAAFLRKLKDSQNRYLWELSITAGQPDTVFGKPVLINNDQDSTFVTNKRLVLFGDFSYYQVRDSGDVTFIRADELRVLNHQVVFLAFQRSDGRLPDTTAIKHLRTA